MRISKNLVWQKFKNHMLTIYTPKPIYNIHNPNGLKLLTRLRLGLSHLNEHKFNHNFKEPFIRIKLILKFHKDCIFAGRFHIHLFFLLIFFISFLLNLRIALYQKGLTLIHISYNRIDKIIMAKMDYMENWNYILFGHAHLSITLNLIN